MRRGRRQERPLQGLHSRKRHEHKGHHALVRRRDPQRRREQYLEARPVHPDVLRPRRELPHAQRVLRGEQPHPREHPHARLPPEDRLRGTVDRVKLRLLEILPVRMRKPLSLPHLPVSALIEPLPGLVEAPLVERPAVHTKQGREKRPERGAPSHDETGGVLWRDPTAHVAVPRVEIRE